MKTYINYKVPLMVAISTMGLMGGVSPQKNTFYVTPLQTNSHTFDTVDLVSGTARENIIDFAKGSTLPFVRTYTSNNKRHRQPLGNFTHSFDKKLNAKIPYKKEVIASKRKQTPKLACEMGWKEISPTVYLGKLEDLSAVYEDETGLCQVYDDYHNLKTTLLIKNKATRTLVNADNIKLLTRPNGTEVLFYKNENNTWSNTTNEAMKFTQTENGYEILLENGNIESYSDNGRLQEIKSDAKVYTLVYDIDGKLARIDDNFEHTITFEYMKDGKRLKKVTNFDGTSVKYRYKGKKLAKVIYPDGRVESYTYDKQKLTEVIKDNVIQRSYSYDDEGKVEKLLGINESNPKTFTYDKDGIEVEEHGIITHYAFIVTHSKAKLDSVTDNEGTLSYAYDDNGHQLAFTDKIGTTRLTQYNKKGLLEKDTENIGTQYEDKISTVYDEKTHKPIIIDGGNKQEYQVYDAQGKLTYKVDALVDDNGAIVQNKIEHIEYDSKGLRTQTSLNNEASTIKHDARGNAVEEKNHLGLTKKITKYNQADLPLLSIDSDGEVTKNQYDITGKPISRTKDGKTSTMKYDKQGRLIENKDADGIVSHFKYDVYGNIIQTNDSTGEKILNTYDTQGNLIKMQRFQDGTLVYQEEKEYDSMRRVTAKIDAYDNRTTYEYNDAGQKIKTTDALGHETRYEYNEIGKLQKEIDAYGNETSYEYDNKGHIISIVTPNGATFTYKYDGFDRLIEESNPDKGLITYAYDASDRLLSKTNKTHTKTNAKGDVQTNMYDTLGRQSGTEYDDASLNVHYSYDDKSQLVAISDGSGKTHFGYDKDNMVEKTQTIDNHTFVTKHTYAGHEKIKSTTYPSGLDVSYTYNNKGETVGLNIDNQPYLSSIDLKYGKLRSYSYQNGMQHTRSYDLAGRLTSLVYPKYTEEISYNAISDIINISIDGNARHFAYDDINRLINYEANETNYQKFTYDANGNRLSKDSYTNTNTYDYRSDTNILEQIQSNTKGTTQYSYDDVGNIIDDGKHAYAYDGRNRLVGVDDNISYQYNYANERVSKTINGTTTYYIYDGHKLLGEYDAEGTVLREYVYLDDTPVAFVQEGKIYTIYADHLDTPRRVVDENHAILWQWNSTPFGEGKATGSLTFNLRFPGQYYDAETAHHYNINRDYNPVTGRYTQSDPIGFKGGVNTYAYAEGNPVMKQDKMGLWASSWTAYLLGGLPIHQRINQAVFGNTWKTRIFDDMTVAVDTYKESTWDSYFHAMNSHKRSRNYSVALANEHVKSGFGVARYYINRGDGRNAYRNLGWVLHTMQDSTSRAHKYFQTWHGATWKYRTEEWANHVRQEMWSGQVRPSAYSATRWVWHMFYYRLVPTGNVFVF